MNIFPYLSQKYILNERQKIYEKKCGEKMFSQKKKRSKGLLFLIPVLLLFLAGLALNAFMSGGAEKEAGDGADEDRLVSAGYRSGHDDGAGENADKGSGDDISDKINKEGNNADPYEYNDNISENKGALINGYDDGDVDPDGYYYGSDPYSEMYDDENVSNGGHDSGSGAGAANDGYSGYRAISENDMLVIYKYSNGAVISEKRTDVQTDTLPEYDREMLENGIDIGSESELDELLEDYEG